MDPNDGDRLGGFVRRRNHVADDQAPDAGERRLPPRSLSRGLSASVPRVLRSVIANLTILRADFDDGRFENPRLAECKI